MRIGLITEGLPDQAVLKNIINGTIDDYILIPIRPIDLVDETDIHLKNNAAAGGFSRIKKDCEEGKLFEEFFELEIGNRKNVMVIQVDTAEVDNFNITRPTKKGNENYAVEIRNNVIEKIKIWLATPSFEKDLVFAISVEELEAWVLTLFENRNSVSSMDPKSKLKKLLRAKNKSTSETHDNYLKLTKPFSKNKQLKKGCAFNESLLLFVQDLENHLNE